MNNVIYVEFPKQSKRKLPRKRVFYLGQYYAGPPLCQSLEHLWLKRKPDNRWVFQQKTYGIVFEYEECHGDDLLAQYCPDSHIRWVGFHYASAPLPW